MKKNRGESGYKPIGWQNFNRRLTRKELDEIGSRISGLHFSKEAFVDDPVAMQALFAAEALYREILLRIENESLPNTED